MNCNIGRIESKIDRDIDVYIQIKHDDPEEFQRAVKAWQDGIFLTTLYPVITSTGETAFDCICDQFREFEEKVCEQQWMSSHDLVNEYPEFAHAWLEDEMLLIKVVMIGKPPLKALDYLHRRKKYDVKCLYSGPKHFGAGRYENGVCEHQSNDPTKRDGKPLSDEVKEFVATCEKYPGPSVFEAASNHMECRLEPDQVYEYMWLSFQNADLEKSREHLEFDN